MIDTGHPIESSVSELDFPAWPFDELLTRSHRELHQYTTRSGLEGIWKTNSLWATHFSNLSDSSEILLLRKPLEAALITRFQGHILERKRKSLRAQRYIDKEGGVEAVARALVHSFVDANFVLAFTGGKVRPLTEPFICSFCSHSNDHMVDWRLFASFTAFL